SVIDTGKGIPEDDIKRVFEPFFVVDKSRRHDMDGFGMGLAICDRIRKVLKIDIDITSEPGKGTVIMLVFPAEMLI
ncbi:MAG: ATP-binding protein, partial [Acetatifactor sp.]|nr:ATP-binding protein [Acetatifactor sp.]